MGVFTGAADGRTARDSTSRGRGARARRGHVRGARRVMVGDGREGRDTGFVAPFRDDSQVERTSDAPGRP